MSDRELEDDEEFTPGFGGLGGWRGQYDEPGSPDYLAPDDRNHQEEP